MNEDQPQRQPLPDGFQLAEYRITHVLGSGGLGITYLAVDENLRNEVALKEYCPLKVSVRGPDLRIRSVNAKVQPAFDRGLQDFLREARILANFSHPNIVAVQRFLEAMGTAYLVMEYVEGKSLRGKLIERPGEGMPESEVRGILEPIIEGLAELHAQGIIHRDIKPDNIFVGDDGVPLLIDFGGARDFWSTEGTDLSYLVSPNYAPIEQHGDRVPQGPWSDIYGLAGTAYAMVTGLNPVSSDQREDGAAMLSARAAAKGRYSDELLDALDTALNLDPRKRPQSLEDWQALLEAKPILPEAMTTLIASAHGELLRQLTDISRTIGRTAGSEEALVFALAFCVSHFHYRGRREVLSEDAWDCCEELAAERPAADMTDGDPFKPESKPLRETFLSRFRSYDAAYTLDRERGDGRHPLTAERLLLNVFPEALNSGIALGDSAPAAAERLVQEVISNLNQHWRKARRWQAVKSPEAE